MLMNSWCFPGFVFLSYFCLIMFISFHFKIISVLGQAHVLHPISEVVTALPLKSYPASFSFTYFPSGLSGFEILMSVYQLIWNQNLKKMFTFVMSCFFSVVQECPSDWSTIWSIAYEPCSKSVEAVYRSENMQQTCQWVHVCRSAIVSVSHVNLYNVYMWCWKLTRQFVSLLYTTSSD